MVKVFAIETRGSGQLATPGRLVASERNGGRPTDGPVRRPGRRMPRRKHRTGRRTGRTVLDAGRPDCGAFAESGRAGVTAWPLAAQLVGAIEPVAHRLAGMRDRGPRCVAAGVSLVSSHDLPSCLGARRATFDRGAVRRRFRPQPGNARRARSSGTGVGPNGWTRAANTDFRLRSRYHSGQQVSRREHGAGNW